MQIKLKHPNSNVIEQIPVGFSWTIIFFYPLVPLFRGDIKYLFLFVVIGLLTFGVGGWLFFAWQYNEICLKKLLRLGYIPADDKAKAYLIRVGFYKND